MEKCRRKGVGDAVAHIAEELGLQDVLKEKTVFQRLYDDAMHRVNRLEKLREKVKKQRQDLWPAKGTPRAAAGELEARHESTESSVYDCVGESKMSNSQTRLVENRRP